MDKKDFKQLVDLAMQLPGRANMRQVVEKEILHYDIFHALDKGSLLKNLVFQGGTSLRLCHGSNRFSEDLDFAAGKNFNADGMHEVKSCIEKYLGERYGLKVEVKEPKDAKFDAVKVDKWQVSVETSPAQRDMPRQRIKIEVAGVPAYTKELTPLRRNYDFLQGYDSLLVNTESLSEVMADKILAFPVAKNIRHRDIWDLAWLSQQGATLLPELVKAKIGDYRVQDYPEQLATALQNLPEVVRSKAFHDQMTRFIDADTIGRTLAKPEFSDYLIRTVSGLFTEMQDHLSRAPTPDASDEGAMPFKM